MASKKNLQLVDLGLDRRIEITTADDKRDPYARFTEKDLEGLRKSVQDPLTARLQDENKKHLDAWSNFHQKVEIEEGAFTGEPQLMNGQSHRAHLHFDMRHKEGLVSKAVGHSHHTRAGRTHHLDPALGTAKSTVGRLKQPAQGLGITRPAFGKPQGGNRFGRSKALKIQRRPIRAPQNYEVMLADPGSWLSSVRNKTGQADTLASPSTSQVETASKANPSLESESYVSEPSMAEKAVTTSQAPVVIKPLVKMPATVDPKPTATVQQAGITQTVATTSALGLTKPVVASQINVTPKPHAAITAKPASAVQPVATPKPTGTPKPVQNLESPFFGLNLPQPQTKISTLQAQARPTKDADLLLDLDSPPKKTGLEPIKGASEADIMELDEDGDKSNGNTTAASVLADFNLSDSKQKTLLEDRQKKLLDMIHAASNPKIRKPQQMIPPPEKLIELSPTPLQKAVTARPFVPTTKPTFVQVQVQAPVKGGLEASRWADADVEMANIFRESPKTTFKSRNTSNNSENPVNYWQKTLPKLPPLPADFEKKYSSTALKSPAPPKATKSLYESRYAN